jgi:tripartite-type tricarboxylate transporter receptor subunit TctC
MKSHLLRLILWFSLLPVVSMPFAQHGFAQQYPSRPITWVVPYPAGGNPDIVVRYLAKGIGEALGQPIVVDNRTGAAGIIGTEYVAAAKPDGYTILYAASSIMTVIPAINKKLTFAPLRDFAAVHGLGSYDMVLVTNATGPYKDIKSLIEFAKKNPGKLNYGSTGVGTTSHLATAYFEKLADIRLTHIPYRGGAQSIPSLIANDLDLLFDYPAATKSLIEAGKLNALATTGSSRVTSLPGVGTLQDVGFPGVTFSPWDVVLVPAATPKDVRDKLSAALHTVLSREETRKFFEERGAKPLADLADDRLIAFINAEASKMKDIVDRAGITAE